jgi:hypothetical protein
MSNSSIETNFPNCKKSKNLLNNPQIIISYSSGLAEIKKREEERRKKAEEERKRRMEEARKAAAEAARKAREEAERTRIEAERKAKEEAERRRRLIINYSKDSSSQKIERGDPKLNSHMA